MSREQRFTKLLDGAPKVQCPTCSVEMILPTLSPHPTPKTELYAATYRCPGLRIRRQAGLSDWSLTVAGALKHHPHGWGQALLRTRQVAWESLVHWAHIAFGRPSTYDPLNLCKAQHYLPTLKGLAVHPVFPRETLYEWGPRTARVISQNFLKSWSSWWSLRTHSFCRAGLGHNHNSTISKLTKHHLDPAWCCRFLPRFSDRHCRARRLWM